MQLQSLPSIIARSSSIVSAIATGPFGVVPVLLWARLVGSGADSGDVVGNGSNCSSVSVFLDVGFEFKCKFEFE